VTVDLPGDRDDSGQDPSQPVPDGKDWTWVLGVPCPECGYDAATVGRESIAERLLAATPRWQAALSRPGVATRPQPQTWSVLEYACHTRDVHTIFGERARLIQGHDDPAFANWDQDVTALEKRYWEADPVQVSAELEAEGRTAAVAFTGLDAQRWSRTGRRSNGSVFTMETLGLYYLHDVEHHLHDVGY
jgi:hypothetical protein